MRVISSAVFAAVFLALGSGCGRLPFGTKRVVQQHDGMCREVGRVLADAAGDVVRDGGSVLVIKPAAGEATAPDVQLIGEAFAREAASRHLRIAAETNMPAAKASGVAPEGYLPPPPPLTLALMKDFTGKAGPIDAVVSFVGEPIVRDGEKAVEGPPVICFAPSAEALAAAMRAGVVKAAVAIRHSAPPANTKDWFTLRYVVVTPTNVEQWAAGKL
jgi:hypothetical protein